MSGDRIAPGGPGLIAAIYARKSTDQNLPDAEKSVARQIEHATAYAARKGWTVDPTHVYQDDGISGAEFAKRPGLVRLLATLTPRPRFQVLIMSEESRLGRETIETAYMLKQFITRGVRVFYYLEIRGLRAAGPIDRRLVERRVRAVVADWRGLMGRQVDESRRFLKGFLEGRVVFTPQGTEVVEFVGRGRMGWLLAGAVVTTVGGVPDGIGSAWTTEFRGVVAA